MNLDQTLKEIDRAHAMGIEVFVIDAGWFKKTGDWEVNKELFPDELKQVKGKISGYGMKLGLWFNPTVAALSSAMYTRNLTNRMSRNGTYGEPSEIWETEQSVGMCLVSSYWEDYANKLIALTKELTVTYFKWDAIGQYGCNDSVMPFYNPSIWPGLLIRFVKKHLNLFLILILLKMGAVWDYSFYQQVNIL